MSGEVLRRHFKDADELCAYVREVSGDTVLLSFSRGKDAIASLHQARRFFGRVVLYHLDMLPEPLRLETEDLRRWEDHLGCEILRYPQPGVVRQLRSLVYQPPGRIAPLLGAELPASYDYAAIEAHLRRRVGVPGAFVALGSRATDSMVRRANIKTNGALHPTRRTFFPIFDWNIDRVIDAVVAVGMGLPDDYKMFGRTLDGISQDYLVPLRERYPDDYERVLRWFPLADAAIHRTTLRANRRVTRTPRSTAP